MRSGYYASAFALAMFGLSGSLLATGHVLAAFAALTCLALIATAGVLFLGRELLLKFRYFGQFAEGTKAEVIYHFPGAQKADIAKGMRNIVLESQDGKPFRALIAFRFELPIVGEKGSIDPYGFVHSHDDGMAIISTYMGNGGAEFVFVVIHPDGSAADVVATSTENDQLLVPDVVYPPHWFQTLSIWS